MISPTLRSVGAFEQRDDVYAHLGPADIAGYPVGILAIGELEDQDQVSVVDLRDMRSEPAARGV